MKFQKYCSNKYPNIFSIGNFNVHINIRYVDEYIILKEFIFFAAFMQMCINVGPVFLYCFLYVHDFGSVAVLCNCNAYDIKRRHDVQNN